MKQFKVQMGVDQKVLTRSYVSHDYLCCFESLRERSAMRLAIENFFVAKAPRLLRKGDPM